MRKIYESQILDKETGELVTDRTVSSKKDNERFMFARTTEGLEWITEFKNLRDLQVLMYLVEFQEPKSGIIIFTGLQIKECAMFFKCTEKTIRNSISSLLKRNLLKRIANNNYISSPYCFYKGGTKGLLTQLDNWSNNGSK